MITEQNWVKVQQPIERGECAVFVKTFEVQNPKSVYLDITAKGVYYAELNHARIGKFIMAPGYTEYTGRHQYQTYDITDLVKSGENLLEVTVANGWYAGRMSGVIAEWTPEMIAQITVSYADGTQQVYGTDGSWMVGDGPILYSDIYNGEIYDATKEVGNLLPVLENRDADKEQLIPQEGEVVIEQERFAGIRIFRTPKGETVVDFGQNLTGYPEVTVTANAGEKVTLSFAEVLDKDGNFYNANYRNALCYYQYTCRDGKQTYKPHCTYYGFRYIRIDEFPESAVLDANTITAVAVYSAIKQKGHISCSNTKLNQLFSNIFWGQRCNFLDIPMDCPQRDERHGWTGDAQLFCKAAGYNFDVLCFFRKWLRDMDALRKRVGYVGFTVPGGATPIAAAYSDAAVIVPWQIYRIYGDKELLEEMIDMMVAHVDMIGRESEEPYTWRGARNLTLRQFGDWLAPDSLDKDRSGDFVSTTFSGATDPDFLQAAYYAYDTEIVAEALEVLGRDCSYYRDLHEKIKEKFREDFPVYHTQTECIFALRLNLTPDREATMAQLVRMIRENGNRMATGLIGTPQILHVLSENGRTDLAYTLLLQEEFPSWLFSVNLGATTIWEHWDGINQEGEMWNARMNSFNHYTYGAVADWIYEVAAGIGQEKDSAGFEHLVIAPHPDKRLEWFEASLETEKGKISSKWIYMQGGIRYEISVPTEAQILLGTECRRVEKGSYVFFVPEK